jgi:hypothetical protein
MWHQILSGERRTREADKSGGKSGGLQQWIRAAHETGASNKFRKHSPASCHSTLYLIGLLLRDNHMTKNHFGLFD